MTAAQEELDAGLLAIRAEYGTGEPTYYAQREAG
jgi:hypothetical protein